MRQRILRFEDLTFDEVTALQQAVRRFRAMWKPIIHAPGVSCLAGLSPSGQEWHLATLSPGIFVVNKSECSSPKEADQYRVEIIIEASLHKACKPGEEITGTSPLMFFNMASIAMNLVSEALGDSLPHENRIMVLPA